MRYLFATDKTWHLEAFAAARSALPGTWGICMGKDDLADAVAALNPRFAFFPHWSHKVPQSVLDKTECVCFHMADVPYGRGGSPLQNLILRGHSHTKLSALRMTDELDAGPVYLKETLSLDGSAQDIFKRTSEIVVEMIQYIVSETPDPVPQSGTPTLFTRRKPEQSLLPKAKNAAVVYDHIRMLDAPGYPSAFIDHGPWRLHFSDAKRPDGNNLTATVNFQMKGSPE
jgi:methionyl-tRNA formyltransferase